MVQQTRLVRHFDLCEVKTLTEGSALPVEGSVLLDFGIKFELLDAFVLREEVARSDEVFKILFRHTVRDLKSLDLRLHDDVVSDDSSHASRSVRYEHSVSQFETSPPFSIETAPG